MVLCILAPPGGIDVKRPRHHDLAATELSGCRLALLLEVGRAPAALDEESVDCWKAGTYQADANLGIATSISFYLGGSTGLEISTYPDKTTLMNTIV